MGEQRDEEFEKSFLREKHVQFVLGLDFKTDTFEYYATEHLKMSGVYWGVMAMELLGARSRMDQARILEFVLACQHPNGGFGGNIGHDPHLLYTLSAVQVLAIFDSLHLINKAAVTTYVLSLQLEDGSVLGDAYGEIDTRFSYCALNCLAILGPLSLIIFISQAVF